MSCCLLYTSWWSGWLGYPQAGRTPDPSGIFHKRRSLSWAKEWEARNDSYRALLVSSLADRLVEAFAAIAHDKLRLCLLYTSRCV